MSGCKLPIPRIRAPIPRFMPAIEDQRCSVWISEKPKAFITRGYGILGGQIEISGDMCTIEAVIIYDYSLNFRKFDDVYSFDDSTGKYKRNFEDTVYSLFGFETIYKEDSIICKAYRRSKYFAGQKIVFTKYTKDEVTPAEFGFDLEEWDYFVPIEMREERVSNNYPEETPIPIPIPEPTPAPTALSEQGPMYLSTAAVISSRQSFLSCRSRHRAARSTHNPQQTPH